MTRKTGPSSAVITSFIVLVIALGFIGWLIFGSVQQQSSQPTNQSKVPEESQTVGSIVQIKELGVELTVSNSLKDLTYVTRELEADFKAVAISTATLAIKDSGCSASGQAAPLGKLFKRQGTYPAQPTYENGILVKQFTSYYLAWQTPQSVCTESREVEESAAGLRKEFQQALKSVKEIQ